MILQLQLTLQQAREHTVCNFVQCELFSVHKETLEKFKAVTGSFNFVLILAAAVDKTVHRLLW